MRLIERIVCGLEEVPALRGVEQGADVAPIQPTYSFWDRGRVPALSEQHLQHAIECMAAFLQFDDQVAEPIFGPYFQGPALLAKSDIHVSTEAPVKNAFMASLCGAIKQFGGWDGQQASLATKLDRIFTPIIPNDNNRQIALVVLYPPAPTGPISPDTIATKQLVDLYLIRTARDHWIKDAQDKQPVEPSTDS